MKKLLSQLLLWIFVVSTTVAQNVNFSENFNAYQGIGDRVSGWQGGSFGFKVYIGHGEGTSPANKGLAKGFGANAPLDSTITPWFGPVSGQSTLSFITRSSTFLGNSPIFNYVPSGADQFLVLGASESDSMNYILLRDLFADYQSAQGLSFFTVNESLSEFAGQRMKLKFRSRCANTSNPWQDIDNIEVTTVSNTKPVKQQVQEGFQISPNPGHGVFRVTIGKEKTRNYKLFNALGSLVAEGQLQTQHENLDLRAQHKGIYFLRIGETTRRIVIR